MKLIVGLGNPDPQYRDNRHNLGFMCVNHFARTQRIALDKRKANARVGEGTVGGVPVVIARPQTYMNASGEAVRALMRRFKASLEDLIVVYDDLDLPLGRIRIRQGGSSGGHNGIQSIISETGGTDFVRVRIGIGRPPKGEGGGGRSHVIDHVLTGFDADEKACIDEVIPRVSEALKCIVVDGIVTAMDRYNPRPEPKA